MMMPLMQVPTVFNHTINALGEGPLWHPGIQSLFWFDILNNTIHMSDGLTHKSWIFECFVSAAGWVSNEKLVICLLYTSPSPRDGLLSRMPSSA